MEHVIAGKLKLGRKIGSGSFEELYLDDIVNNFCDFKTLGVLHCIPTSNIEVKSRFGDFEMVDAGPVTPQQVLQFQCHDCAFLLRNLIFY
ncbi:hypothetical protein FF1_014527 [Malus domestica]